ncbi:hypothetical protein ZOSMA_119G00280 [Zostera marina]|uniref:Uncharacterized protein n=1 Tax=Zostera marina TaxID=29655 RepID=A0A0K9Q3Q4_ZOSMR|nr:hypothetical protein ZOSMA_119G00280 [Zostera marina]
MQLRYSLVPETFDSAGGWASAEWDLGGLLKISFPRDLNLSGTRSNMFICYIGSGLWSKLFLLGLIEWYLGPPHRSGTPPQPRLLRTVSLFGVEHSDDIYVCILLPPCLKRGQGYGFRVSRTVFALEPEELNP